MSRFSDRVVKLREVLGMALNEKKGTIYEINHPGS